MMALEGDDPLGDWDSVAEEELRSIEAAYFKRRRRNCCSGLEAEGPRPSDRRSNVRRLPDWGRRCTTSGDASSSSPLGAPVSCPRTGRWSLPSASQDNLRIRYPAMTFTGRIVYCRTTAEVEKATKELMDKIRDPEQANQVSLGFDIEWKPTFQRGEAPSKAAVMQICMDTANCYVMHIIHSGIPPLLKFLLEDPSTVKVGVCIANDAWKISKDYDVCVQPLEDLSTLANLKFGGHKQWGLSSLVETTTCKQLEKPKKIRMGNWECNMLTREQLTYAATDAYASWYLYQVLKSFPCTEVESEILDGTNNLVSDEHPNI